jgi:hypothetical protein
MNIENATWVANLKTVGLSGVPESFNPDNLQSYEMVQQYKIGSTNEISNCFGAVNP